jgi:PPK2 family polyphosphate:nucleotide phosphotransferase
LGDGRSLRELLRVRPGTKVDLDEWDPAETHGHVKDTADQQLAAGVERLAELQDRLWAEAKHPVLVILQGIDAAGKDSTIRHVMGAFNPQGVTVSSFKVPTAIEAAHDFLWRIHQRTPGKGEIAIFNRSHYEEVLVVRVHELVPRDVWSRHYDQINAFEKMLAEEGTTIVKFFLWISKEEQREQFQERIDDPSKHWKFRKADLDERARWAEYQRAFEDALSRCSTEWAPWYVIPSDRKWFRNVAVAEILGDTIADLEPQYPPGEPGIEALVVA